jgi:hypothetical protein
MALVSNYPKLNEMDMPELQGAALRQCHFRNDRLVLVPR